MGDDAVAGGFPGERDYGLLNSALARPQSSVFGQDAYPDVWQKAAALMESLARNRALVDGNKRIAWYATWVFLHMNGHPLDADCDVDEAETFGLDVWQGRPGRAQDRRTVAALCALAVSWIPSTAEVAPSAP